MGSCDEIKNKKIKVSDDIQHRFKHILLRMCVNHIVQNQRLLVKPILDLPSTMMGSAW